MMTGSVEHPFQRSHAINQLGVKPELVEQIELGMGDEMTGRYEERHWQIKQLPN